MKHQNVLVLGASGATGRWVVQMAAERGHHITALVRSKENIEKRDGLEIIQGDVMDAATLERVMEGKDAVLSCLGIGRKSASNPWSPLTSPTDFSATSAQSIVTAMKKHGVGRLIAISAAGAGDSREKVDSITRLLFRTSNLAITLRDSENMEEVYRNSGLDSLAVRPARLVNGEPTNRARIVERCGISSKIARSDVAGWMLDALERAEPFKSRSEMIAWK
jgi:putative NADH-flavin reductase